MQDKITVEKVRTLITTGQQAVQELSALQQRTVAVHEMQIRADAQLALLRDLAGDDWPNILKAAQDTLKGDTNDTGRTNG